MDMGGRESFKCSVEVMENVKLTIKCGPLFYVADMVKHGKNRWTTLQHLDDNPDDNYFHEFF